MAAASLPAEARKKSPRAPSIALDEALERVLKVYERERLHAVPSDIAAQHMGYKDANNGRVLGILASLRYYGLIERSGEGLVAVAKDVEAFKFAPNPGLCRSFLLKFLTTPPLFAELLDRYGERLPSDGALKYELIQRGFLPATAQGLVGILKRSMEFVGEEEKSANLNEEQPPSMSSGPAAAPPAPGPASQSPHAAGLRPAPPTGEVFGATSSNEDADHDRIPVRLPGGRRAWLVIPSVFFEADKARLKAQIDLLLSADEEEL
jgi:hypothetical protein